MTRAREQSALLFGPNGQVGRALAERLPSLMRVIPVDRAAVDLRNAAAIRDAIAHARPTHVINAAAYTAVDAAETDEGNAYAVNAEAPRAMAEAAANVGATVIHFSTDYVFDGTARTPYTEDSQTNPLSVYGRSKLAGDQALQESNAPYLIFRTSWVYSAQGKNFLNAILKRARETGKLRVVNDQVGAPTTADAIADAVVTVLAGSPQSGIYNLTAAGSTTWFDFAHEILKRSGVVAELTPISTADFGAPAPRPAYSLLDGSKLRDSFGIQLADWGTQLDRVLSPVAGRSSPYAPTG